MSSEGLSELNCDLLYYQSCALNVIQERNYVVQVCSQFPFLDHVVDRYKVTYFIELKNCLARYKVQ